MYIAVSWVQHRSYLFQRGGNTNLTPQNYFLTLFSVLGCNNVTDTLNSDRLFLAPTGAQGVLFWGFSGRHQNITDLIFFQIFKHFITIVVEIKCFMFFLEYKVCPLLYSKFWVFRLCWQKLNLTVERIYQTNLLKNCFLSKSFLSIPNCHNGRDDFR